VGGHRAFRPSAFVRELSGYDMVSVGPAGTFVLWKPGPVAKFRAELKRKLPIETDIIFCDARDLIRVAIEHPFGDEQLPADVVRFLSVLPRAGSKRPSLPVMIPQTGDWLVHLIASRGQFVFGEYRRHMKTIGYLAQIDKLFGGKATTRNWNTITKIVTILNLPRESRA